MGAKDILDNCVIYAQVPYAFGAMEQQGCMDTDASILESSKTSSRWHWRVDQITLKWLETFYSYAQVQHAVMVRAQTCTWSMNKTIDPTLSSWNHINL